MALSNIKGITIQFDGDTTKLGQKLKDIDQKTRSLDSELKQVNKALKFNPSNVELWRQKQELLNAKVTETEKRLKALKLAQKEMDTQGVSRNSEEYRELQREIITTESKLKNFNKQLYEAKNIRLTELQKSFEKIGQKAEAAGRSLTTYVTAPIVAGYTASAKYASDYEENLNKIDVAFGKSAKSVKKWANNAREQFGLSKVQATDAASAFGALGKGIGLTESQAADMSTTLAGLSADLGSYFNTGVDESAKALEGIFTGESEALKKFGVVMTDTNLQKFAADQGLVWKEMDQTEKTMLRYQYVMTKTKDAQGDFSRTSDGTANSTKIFRAAVQDLATSIGTNLLPIITPVIQKITEWINKFNELSPETQKIITIVGLVVASIGPLLVIIGKLATGISAIINLVNLVGGATTALSLGPIAGVAAAVAIAIAAGVLLYKNWDKIKKLAKALGDKIKNVWTSIKTATSDAWESIKESVTGPFKSAYEKVKKIIDKIKDFFPIKLGKIFKGIKLPHFDVEWSTITAFGKSIDFPSGFDISWYKKGGIFDNPSLIGVGEAGPEAVVPLDKFWEKLDNMQGGDVTINVYPSAGMNETELARKVEQALARVQKQRNLAYGNI